MKTKAKNAYKVQNSREANANVASQERHFHQLSTHGNKEIAYDY